MKFSFTRLRRSLFGWSTSQVSTMDSNDAAQRLPQEELVSSPKTDIVFQIPPKAVVCESQDTIRAVTRSDSQATLRSFPMNSPDASVFSPRSSDSIEESLSMIASTFAAQYSFEASYLEDEDDFPYPDSPSCELCGCEFPIAPTSPTPESRFPSLLQTLIGSPPTPPKYSGLVTILLDATLLTPEIRATAPPTCENVSANPFLKPYVIANASGNEDHSYLSARTLNPHYRYPNTQEERRERAIARQLHAESLIGISDSYEDKPVEDWSTDEEDSEDDDLLAELPSLRSSSNLADILSPPSWSLRSQMVRNVGQRLKD
ncbi:hypothetical protein ONZ45_g17531 [Pleurotus djamor]|nr:hypothetical protein ONZ45_g17531 [Pleurotus djamor]